MLMKHFPRIFVVKNPKKTMKHPLFKQKAKAQTSNNMKCNFLQCERFREISKASNEDCEKMCAAFFSEVGR